MALDNDNINLSDLVRAYQAKLLAGLTTTTVLDLHAEKLGKVVIGSVAFWSAKACRQWRLDRPDILRVQDVADILGCSRQNVTAELNRYLKPVYVSWGGFPRVRSYDRERVAELKRLRDLHRANGANGRVTRDAYASLIVAETSAPSSEGMAPTVVGKLSGTAPKQTIRAKTSKAQKIGEAVEIVKTDAVNRLDRKRHG